MGFRKKLESISLNVFVKRDMGLAYRGFGTSFSCSSFYHQKLALKFLLNNFGNYVKGNLVGSILLRCNFSQQCHFNFT